MQNLLDSVKRLLGSDIRIPRHVYVLAAILLVAFDLRIQSSIHSIVDSPVRPDAQQYLLYAYNMKYHGVYSQTNTLFTNSRVAPVPDAIRAPLYPLFMSLFLDHPPTVGNLSEITRAQIFISMLTVPMVFWISRLFLPMALALTATALTAISPHLVTMNVYLISETLFCFFVVSAILLIARSAKRPGITTPMLAGLALGAAALTHPMLLYFILPLGVYLVFGWRRSHGWKKIAVIILGFSILYGAWIARNLHTLGVPGDNTLMLAALRAGAYENMTYQDNPQSYGIPYRFDPDFEETSKDISAVMTEVIGKFRESPTAQLRWYMLDKPITLWSWNMIPGTGDVFVYPMVSSPYYHLPHFQVSHVLMRTTHWFFVVLMAVGIIIAWLPAAWSRLSRETVVVARVISVLLLYHAGIMMIGFPLPRYAVPMYPFLYAMSMFTVATAIQWAGIRMSIRSEAN
jgi:4-amino-4-deoxy-L-arabinose transferase-like glycosyltransferase